MEFIPCLIIQYYSEEIEITSKCTITLAIQKHAQSLFASPALALVHHQFQEMIPFLQVVQALTSL